MGFWALARGEMSGEDGGLPASPAAAVRARRESRTPIPERLREAAREDDSDEEYEPEEEEQYDSDLDADKAWDKDDDCGPCVDECGFTAQQSCPPGCRSMTIGAAAWLRGSGCGRW